MKGKRHAAFNGSRKSPTATRLRSVAQAADGGRD